MSNSLYPLGRQKWLEGDIAWLADDIKAVLLSAAYVYADAHDFLDDLSGVLSTSANLSGKTSTLGVADAADVVFAAVVGAEGTQIVIYKDTGVAATSPLLVHFDTNSSSVLLSVTPNGTDITALWSNGPLKIFRL